MEWRRAVHGEGEEIKENGNAPGHAPEVPSPRANTSACLIGNKVYLFGGHGGQQYQRIAFNDVWSFDCDTFEWKKVEPQNNPPEARGGHTAFSIDSKIFVYGGWNSENQFSNLLIFNTETEEWTDPDIYHEQPRWNHCAAMVEAIPSWKYFIFGGETGEFPEGGPRQFGGYINSTGVLDIETMMWTSITTEDAVGLQKPFLPKAREYGAMIYDHKGSRLLVFGGWANEWMCDIHALNVSSIVGPSYAVTEIVPNLG